jgi:hypothetical protein
MEPQQTILCQEFLQEAVMCTELEHYCTVAGMYDETDGNYTTSYDQINCCSTSRKEGRA